MALAGTVAIVGIDYWGWVQICLSGSYFRPDLDWDKAIRRGFGFRSLAPRYLLIGVGFLLALRYPYAANSARPTLLVLIGCCVVAYVVVGASVFYREMRSFVREQDRGTPTIGPRE